MTDLHPFISFLQTPPLWEGTQFEIPQFIFPEIDLNRFSPTFIPTRIRLGHQMEHVCYQLLSKSADYEVRIHNLPIKNTTRTIGEIDFIIEHKLSNEFIHVELTYKFYLVDTSISEPIHQLIGPNRKDSFFRKMEKIKQKQFHLLHTTEGVKALKEYTIDHEAILHQACFKAQVFVPYESSNQIIEPFNNACIVGFWINSKQFNRDEFHAFEYYIPPKSSWILTPNDKVVWKSHQEITQEIHLKLNAQIAPMLWIKKSEIVIEKCFVVWW